MTDQELHDYSADHLYYELSMLYETAARLVHEVVSRVLWKKGNGAFFR